jgi:superfamily II DNA helicase RecQ
MVEAVFENKESVLAVLATGAGKSMSWMCPLVSSSSPGLSIVVIPLSSLLLDVTNKLDRMSGVTLKWTTWSKVKAAKVSPGHAVSSLKLLVVSVEQARDPALLQLVEELDRTNVLKRVIFDEPSLYLQSNFRQHMRAVPLLIRAKTKVPFVLLSATVVVGSEEEELGKLFFSSLRVIRSCTTRSNVALGVEKVAQREDIAAKVASMIKNGNERTIVFVLSKKECEELANALRSKQVRACFSHSGLGEEAQKAAQKGWVDGSFPVLVATSGYLYGVDHPHVRQVIFVRGAYTMSDLVQGLGRAGRDNASSTCTVLVRPGAEEGNDEVVSFLKDTTCCRLRALSNKFDSSNLRVQGNCGLCDFCRSRSLPRTLAIPQGVQDTRSLSGDLHQAAKQAVKTAEQKVRDVQRFFVSNLIKCKSCHVLGKYQPVHHPARFSTCPALHGKCFRCLGAHSRVECALSAGHQQDMKEVHLCVTCCLPKTVGTIELHSGDDFAAGCRKAEYLQLAMLVCKARNKGKDLSREDLKALTGVSQVDGLVPRVIEILHDTIALRASSSSASSSSSSSSSSSRG